jgi:hypothetical protein
LVAAAAAVTLFALLWTFSTRPKEVAIAPHRTTPAARSQPAPVAAVTAGRNPGIAPVRRRNRLLHVTRKAIQAPNRRTLYALTPPAERDGFVAVPYAPPFPTDEFEVVRVSLATGAKADVVAGVDGIVRAVRWVD